jgi:hypothetical protein
MSPTKTPKSSGPTTEVQRDIISAFISKEPEKGLSQYLMMFS